MNHVEAGRMIRRLDGLQQQYSSAEVIEADSGEANPLEALADELIGHGLVARVIWFGAQQRVSVLNQSVRHLAETIYAAPTTDGTAWFWWSWHDKISPVSEIAQATSQIAKVLTSPNAS